MLRTQSCALALALAFATSARAQDSCNAPAKDAIVQLEVPGSPFEPVITADGCWLFVTLAGGNNGTGQGQIAVVRRDAGKLSVVRTVPIKGGPTGAVLTHDSSELAHVLTAQHVFVPNRSQNGPDRGLTDFAALTLAMTVDELVEGMDIVNPNEVRELLPTMRKVLAQVIIHGDARALQFVLEELIHERHA